MRLVGGGLSYSVGDRWILDGVSVAADSGRLLGINGPSGAGKSTLLSVLAGLVRPDAGTVELDGTAVRDSVEFRRRIGLVLQGYGLVSVLTARENVAITLQTRRERPRDIRRRTEDALHDLGIAEVAEHLVDELSGGQQQRVAVARAVVTQPDVLLADEPTAELDAENRARVMTLLEAAAARGAIVVVASHDPEVMERCAGVVTMDAGRVVATSGVASSGHEH